MPHTFPTDGNAALIVGRTPWSARVPLDPLFAQSNQPHAVPRGRRGRRPVAVGTAVTHCPPHRPVLALLTHTVPTLEIVAPGRLQPHAIPRHCSAPMFSGSVSSI